MEWSISSFAATFSLFSFADFCFNFLPIKTLVSGNVRETSCQTSIFFPFCCVLVFLSCTLDINPEYLNVFFTLEIIDNSFYKCKLLPALWLVLKFLEAFLQPIKIHRKTVKIPGSLFNFSLMIWYLSNRSFPVIFKGFPNSVGNWLWFTRVLKNFIQWTKAVPQRCSSEKVFGK